MLIKKYQFVVILPISENVEKNLFNNKNIMPNCSI